MRRLAVVTTSRADYGCLRPILRRIASADDLQLDLVIVTSERTRDAQLSHARTDGYTVAAHLNLQLDDDGPRSTAGAMARAGLFYTETIAALSPDILLLLGDRFEMHPAACAAVPFLLPVAHIHGGEVTYGAFDDALRHSITKLSHLHFVATEDYGRRVAQMGEETWRITVSGAPSLDDAFAEVRATRGEVEAAVGLTLSRPPIVVTFHAPTLEDRPIVGQVDALLSSLELIDRPVVFTAPNTDPGGLAIRRRIESWMRGRPTVRMVESLGTDLYFGLLALADLMIGNSSSGLIEAPSFELPVVDIGDRQQGRVRAKNVLWAPPDSESISSAIASALEPRFRAELRGLKNPYGSGDAADRIVGRLRSVPLDRRLIQKRFVDLPVGQDGS